MLAAFTAHFQSKHEGLYLFLAQFVGQGLDNGLGPLAVYLLPLGLPDDNTVFSCRIIEKIGDVDIQGTGDIFQRGEGGRALPQLQLRKEAGGKPGLLSEVPERKPCPLPEVLDLVAQVDHLLAFTLNIYICQVMFDSHCNTSLKGAEVPERLAESSW